MATGINYNGFFVPKHPPVPGVYLDQIRLSNFNPSSNLLFDEISNREMSTSYNISMSYHTYFFNFKMLKAVHKRKKFKIAVFCTTSVPSFEGDRRQLIDYLFQEEGDTKLIGIYEIPSNAKERYTIVSSGRKPLYKINMPEVSFSCPRTNNLTVLAVPFLGTQTSYSSYSKSNVFLVGDMIEERLIINGNVNNKRTKFYYSNGQEWPRPKAVYESAGRFRGGTFHTRSNPVLQRRVVSNDKLIESLVTDELLHMLSRSAETQTNLITNRGTTNKNYFSTLFSSRDLSLKLNGLFGIDILGILKNNTIYSKIFDSSSLSRVRKFVGGAKIDIKILKRRSLAYASDEILGNFRAIRAPVHSPAGSERGNSPFVMHYRFEDDKPNNMGDYYEVTLTLNTSNIVGHIYDDLKKINVIKNIITKSKGRGWEARRSLFVAGDIMNVLEYYSTKVIPLEEKNDYISRLGSLLKSFSGRKIIIGFVEVMEKSIRDVFDVLSTGSTFVDTLSTGGKPANLDAHGINYITQITKKYNIWHNAADIVHNAETSPVGVDYLSTKNSRTKSNTNYVISGDHLLNRLKAEEERFTFGPQSKISLPPTDSIVSNVTTMGLNLNAQRNSYLSPSVILTPTYSGRVGKGTDHQIKMCSDTLANIDDERLMIYNYIFVLYKALEARAANTSAYNTKLTIFKEISAVLSNKKKTRTYNHTYDILQSALEKYLVMTKNFTITKDVLKQDAGVAKALYDADDPSDDSTPNIDKKEYDEEILNPINFINLMLSILSVEVFQDEGYDVINRFNMDNLALTRANNDFLNLPNQIKALIHYCGYATKMQNIGDMPEIEKEFKKSVVSTLTKNEGISALGYLYMSFFNLKEIQIFQGYQATSTGDLIMSQPIFNKLTQLSQINSITGGQFAFCRLVDYENSHFNIPSTPKFPMYNEQFLVKPSRRSGRARRATGASSAGAQTTGCARTASTGTGGGTANMGGGSSGGY